MLHFRGQTAPITTTLHRCFLTGPAPAPSAPLLPACLSRGEPSPSKWRGVGRAPPPPPAAQGRELSLPHTRGYRISFPSRRSLEQATPPGKGAGVQSSTGPAPCPNAAMEPPQGGRRGCHRPLLAHAQWGACRLCGGCRGEGAGVSCSLWKLPMFRWPLGKLPVSSVLSRRGGCGGEVLGVPCVFTGA